MGSCQELILEKIYQGVLRLESFNILDNFKVGAHGRCGAEKIGTPVGWIDKVIEDIGAIRDPFELLHETRLLRIQFEVLQEQMDRVGRGLLSSTLRCHVATSLPIPSRIIKFKL